MIFGGLFDFDKKEEKIKKLEEITKESNFWDDVSLANKKITELNNLKKLEILVFKKFIFIIDKYSSK